MSLGGLALSDLRAFMVATERRPALLNNHHDVRDWIVRMSGVLGERAHKRPRSQPAEAPSNATTSGTGPSQSRIPVPAWSGATTVVAAPAQPPARLAPSMPPPAQPIPSLVAHGQSTMRLLSLPATPAAAPPPPSPAPSVAFHEVFSSTRDGTPAPGRMSRVPLGLSPFLNAQQHEGGGARAAPLDGVCASKFAAALDDVAPPPLASHAAPSRAEDTPPIDDAGHGGPDSPLLPTPSLASPPKSTRRLRPSRSAGGSALRAQLDGSPALSTPSFTASPPKSTRRMQPARGSLGWRAAGGQRSQPPPERTPSLPATPRLSASPPKSTRCRRQQRGSLGWSESSSPPPMPSLLLSPPRTVGQLRGNCSAAAAASPADAEPASPAAPHTLGAGGPQAQVQREQQAQAQAQTQTPASNTRGRASARRRAQAEAQATPQAQAGDAAAEAEAEAAAEGGGQRQLRSGLRSGGERPRQSQPCASNLVRTDGFSLRPPVDLPGPGPGPAAAGHPRASPQPRTQPRALGSADAADLGQAAETGSMAAPSMAAGGSLAPPASGAAPGAEAALPGVALPELDLERFPRMFRQPHSEGAQRLREVYCVLREFAGPLSAEDVAEGLAPAGKYGAQLVLFLLDLLTSRAYLHTHNEGERTCWRAI